MVASVRSPLLLHRAPSAVDPRPHLRTRAAYTRRLEARIEESELFMKGGQQQLVQVNCTGRTLCNFLARATAAVINIPGVRTTSAPYWRRSTTRSFDIESGMVRINR